MLWQLFRPPSHDRLRRILIVINVDGADTRKRPSSEVGGHPGHDPSVKETTGNQNVLGVLNL